MIEADEECHFLSYSQEANHAVSFATRPQYVFDNARRTRTTLGRYVRRYLDVGEEELSASGLELLTDRIFGTLSADDAGELLFTVVHGDAILQAYHQELGGSSCMTGEDPLSDDNPLALYAANPDVVGLLLYRGPGLPEHANGAARALLWTCPCGTRILDRIYPNSGTHVRTMREWAKRQGIVNRTDESMPCDCHPVSLSDGEAYTLRLKTTKSRNVPYLDTFHWGRHCLEEVVVSTDPEDWPHVFDSTRGNYSSVDEFSCEGCGDVYESGDLYSCGDVYYCARCARRYTFVCDSCDSRRINSEATAVENAVWCADCVETHGATCSECGNVFSIYDVDGNGLCRNCAEDGDDEDDEADEDDEDDEEDE
jgi:hypothetical protein